MSNAEPGSPLLAETFGAFVVNAKPPKSLQSVTIDAVSDCIGCILGGADSEVARRVAKGLGGLTGEVPVLGTDDHASPGVAALRMGVAGHSNDFDDWEEPGNTHPTVVMFPALFAATHLTPVPATEFCAAYAIGFEVIVRLGQALGLSHYKRGFHSTATIGAIGAAASVARVLGLSASEATHAISIAASQAIGYTVQFGSNAKPLQAGTAARTGLEAAMMARACVTAQPWVLSDPRGMTGLLSTWDNAQLKAACDRLGAPWALEEFKVVLKPWPSCGYTHRTMTAALDLREALGERVCQADELVVELPDFHRAILPFDQPQNLNEALFSIPACLAHILRHGDLTLADRDARFWETQENRALAARVTVIDRPARQPDLNFDPEQPDVLTLKIGSERHVRRCAYPLGAPQNPMNIAQLAQKFSALTGKSAEVYSRLVDWTDVEDMAQHIREVLA